VRSKSRGGDVISSQEISMVAADNAGPTIEFPSRNERAEELMASDIHCAGAIERVAVVLCSAHPKTVG
jgi:hypothetical protein